MSVMFSCPARCRACGEDLQGMRLPVLSDFDHLQSPKPTQILSLLSD